MRADHEELLLRNPALGARALWHFARSYSDQGYGQAPSLPLCVIAIGMLFHRSTVEKIRRMRLESGIAKAISEQPDVIAGLQARMEGYFKAALFSLQVGSSSGLLRREGGHTFPTFRAIGNDLPKAIRDSSESATDIFNGAKRLGAWFAHDQLDALKRHLLIEF